MLVSLVPAFILIPHILHTWVGIPYWDDWGSPGHQLLLLSKGELSIMELFSPHNQSRPFFPRLVWIPLDWFGWDVRKAMVAIFLMVCVASVLLRRLVGKPGGITALEKLAVLLLMNAVLFWPNSEIWTFENTFMMVWPPVMLLGALHVNLSGASFRRKVLLNSLLATVGTYSWANGMLLWIFALPLPGTVFLCRGFPKAGGKEGAKWYLFYALACAISMAFYFHNLGRTSLSWNIPRVMEYFFTWLGGFFGDYQQAAFLGCCVFFAYAALAGSWFHIARKRRDFTGGYPWLILGNYAVASGILTAMGRVKLGLQQAMSPRYTEMSGYLYIAIIGLGYLVWRHARANRSPGKVQFRGFAAGVMVGLFVPVVVNGYASGFELMKEIQRLRKTVLDAWQWSKVMPDNAGLTLLFPSRDAGKCAVALENNHVLRVKRWEPGVAANWNFNQAATVDNRNGVLDICNIEPGVNRFVVEGWSRLPGREGPADYVLITVCGTDGVTRPFLMLPADNRMRPDVAAALKDERMSSSGFRQDVAAKTLPAGKLTITAWAVDMEHGTISPIASPRVLEAGK